MPQAEAEVAGPEAEAGLDEPQAETEDAQEGVEPRIFDATCDNENLETIEWLGDHPEIESCEMKQHLYKIILLSLNNNKFHP